MSKQLIHKINNRNRRKGRVRALISGTSKRPRLSVHISNLNVNAQLIDDTKNQTLAYVTTVGQKVPGTMTDKAIWVGSEIAAKAKSAKIKSIVFDRNGKLYHGRVAALADAARKSGLEF
ncbi:MAG TPA: 50S ribosomal protein L18 [Candidatus Saccharimonadales bacterium]|nr:50S ribosomal protein L18 [Candidatus Saccharimonadales bacterium]